MISRLNNLVYSENEQLVKQGITLLLSLDLAEDTFHNFKQLIKHSNWTNLTSKKSKLQCSFDVQYAF